MQRSDTSTLKAEPKFRKILSLLNKHGRLSNKEILSMTDEFESHQDLSFRLMELRSIHLVRGPIAHKWELTEGGKTKFQH